MLLKETFRTIEEALKMLQIGNVDDADGEYVIDKQYSSSQIIIRIVVRNGKITHGLLDEIYSNNGYRCPTKMLSLETVAKLQQRSPLNFYNYIRELQEDRIYWASLDLETIKRMRSY